MAVTLIVFQLSSGHQRAFVERTMTSKQMSQSVYMHGNGQNGGGKALVPRS